MEGHLLMSCKELYRKTIVELVQCKRITLVEASVRLCLSYRQTLRVYGRFLSEGDRGLIHRRRGVVSNRSYSDAFREQVLREYRTRFKPHDLGPTLAVEKLAEAGLCVDHETLRRWLLSAGDWKRRRKRRSHRSRRERRLHFGELVQMDGSHHNWFGEEHDKYCLMNMVDDATGRTMGLLDHEETTEAAMNLLRQWIVRYGIPQALYTDRKNVYVTEREPTFEEQLAGEEPMTAFGKACNKLGIEIITAHSPQAKGRVERSNGTYQDRFVKELALYGVTTLALANEILANGFTDGLNERFAIAPVQEEDYHRPLPKGLDMDSIFCHETYRTLGNDWTLRHNNRFYQILNGNKPLPKPKDRILVRTHFDGRVQLIYRDKVMTFTFILSEQLKTQKKTKKMTPPIGNMPTKASKKLQKKWQPNCDRLAMDKGNL